MAEWEEAPTRSGPRQGGGWEEAPTAPRQRAQARAPQSRAPSATASMEMPSYDPMGMPTGVSSAVPTGPAMPYGEQMTNVGRVGKAATQGMIAGIPGIAGDIESLARAGARYAGANVSARSALPTTERVGEYVYGKPKTEEEKKFREAGALFSPVGTLPRALSRGFSATAGRAIPTTSPALERSAAVLESQGLKLDPMQVARSDSLQSPGALGARVANQEQVNRLASAAAGKETRFIDADWLKGRSKALGDEYDRIYGRTINLDAQAKSAVELIRDAAMAVRPAEASDLIASANNILRRFPANANTAQMSGKDLQALRTNLNSIVVRGGPEGAQASQMVKALDEIFLRGVPTNERAKIATDLATNNQRYSAFATLEDLAKSGYTRGGDLDLLALGDYMAKNAPRFVQGRATNPLSELALAGREMKMTGLERGAQGAAPSGSGITARTLSALRTLPVRTSPARTMQRRREAGLPTVAEPSAYPGGVATPVVGGTSREVERQ